MPSDFMKYTNWTVRISPPPSKFDHDDLIPLINDDDSSSIQDFIPTSGILTTVLPTSTYPAGEISHSEHEDSGDGPGFRTGIIIGILLLSIIVGGLVMGYTRRCILDAKLARKGKKHRDYRWEDVNDPKTKF